MKKKLVICISKLNDIETNSIKSRFWSKVNKKLKSKCWVWTGACSNGYGFFGIKGISYKAHRVAYEMKHGPIPKGKLICHHCDNRPCVRPSHLFIGTQKDNIKDAIQKGRMGKGEANGNSKLTEKQVKQIRADIRSERKIASEYNVSKSAVHHIKSRDNWKHIP